MVIGVQLIGENTAAGPHIDFLAQLGNKTGRRCLTECRLVKNKSSQVGDGKSEYYVAHRLTP
jgi:hypothetical protein